MAAKSADIDNNFYFSWKISSPLKRGLVQQTVNCIAGFVRCRSLDSRNIVPSCRTGTLSEIRPDNMYQPLFAKLKSNINLTTNEKNYLFSNLNFSNF